MAGISLAFDPRSLQLKLALMCQKMIDSYLHFSDEKSKNKQSKDVELIKRNKPAYSLQ